MSARPLRQTISASEFKARCLELMDEVSTTRSEVLITKHGTPVARLLPVAAESASAVGFLRGTVRSEVELFESEAQVGLTSSRAQKKK